ncbi:MAG: M48 family metalloprotease [Lachnospiraceae bacterium]|nr:M48 family metalloprotease [Lachnospiraceae bacterium]
MPRKNYYGIFTMLYETLRGNRHMSEYAFLSCLFWSSILVIFYSLIPTQAYSERELCNIIRHECAHLRKRDHMMVLVADFLCALYWWNPCVYLLKRDMERGLEMRCDMVAAYMKL